MTITALGKRPKGRSSWLAQCRNRRPHPLRQTDSVSATVAATLHWSDLLCTALYPILHSPPLPLLCRPCTTIAAPAFFYCRLCLARCSLFTLHTQCCHSTNFFMQNATSNCYLLLGRALLHDFAAWCAWECSGQQQHDMLEEIEEETPQVQHSQHIPQATVETHRSCRASSFCS